VRPHAIHQFHSSAAYGDGITKGMLFTQRILRESGYESNIYCVHIEDIMSAQTLPFQAYENRPDDVLLFHYSLGTVHDAWITGLRSALILVYHNITPAHFFPVGSDLRRFSEQGRRQLARWALDKMFVGVIADSEYNAKELRYFGYTSIASIPLLVDLDRIRAHAWNPRLAKDIEGYYNLLFIGRLAPSKGQIDLVRMMEVLRAMIDAPIRLLLAGATTSEPYEAEIREAIDRLGLADNVRLLGRRIDDDIYALYRTADLYVSLSRHEGFGMPLVEAMAFDLPVLALTTESIAATLGSGGLITKAATAVDVAVAAKSLLRLPWLRRRVIEGQRGALTHYERPGLESAFEQHLRQLGFDVALNQTDRAAPHSRAQWMVEGPFDSSYSLAIVNRELARSLTREGELVGLRSRDGDRSFDPDVAFLEANPDIAGLVEQARVGVAPAVCLRNQFPPNVTGMRGALRVLANYAWEESGFPARWVEDFNASLDLITAASAYVAKVLRDNGVHIPIHVVGNGADHTLVRSGSREHHSRFRFLHVSSGFPRKGVDVLLAAWGEAFSNADPVELVIKVFPNSHNRIDSDIGTFLKGYPDGVPVIVINELLGSETMELLYASADALVCPSRGEGFGLPLAEAMARGIPVIATSYGGQSDFCSTDTAWLCDYAFAYAQTHLEVFDSVWAEPDRSSVSRAMRDVFQASPDERAARVEAGRSLILSHYTWDHVADRTRAAIASVSQSSLDMPHPPKIGLVSTWNIRCGIAAYARALVSGIESERLVVFANNVVEVTQPDEAYVHRCWVPDWSDPLDELFQEIRKQAVDAVVIQFNYGFFHPRALSRLLDRMRSHRIPVFMTLHSTKDLVGPNVTVRLADLSMALATVRRLLVHSVHDLNRLKSIGLVDNVALFPMGVPEPFSGDRATVRRTLGLEAATVIASFGYLLPHKGLPELIDAVGLLRATIPNVHLLMLNALYPIQESVTTLQACQEKVRGLELQNNLTLVTDFLSEPDITALLAAADVIVYPYQTTQESASAAVKAGLASLTPVAVTPLDVFADVASVTFAFAGTTSADIAQGLLELLSDSERKSALSNRQRVWATGHGWPALSGRLDGLIRGEISAILRGTGD
jgi:glycosyltransferase involved in cell wall biosynthesis